MTPEEIRRQQIRDSIGRADPQLLKLLDNAKKRFNARMTGLVVTEPDGTVTSIGTLAKGKSP